MMKLYQVTAKRGLNLREAPIHGPVIKALSYGEIVEFLGQAQKPGWWQVSASAGHNEEIGFVSADYLFEYDPKPKNGFTLTQSNLKANFERVKMFVGDFAHSHSPDILVTLNDILGDYDINRSNKRFTHFMAQIAHESAHFTRLDENLWYTGAGLWRVFRKHFESEEDAEDHSKQPEKIANKVYANRMGNGPEDSGDGYRYRGRGFIQLTGKDNYKAIGDRIGLDLVGNLISLHPMLR